MSCPGQMIQPGETNVQSDGSQSNLGPPWCALENQVISLGANTFASPQKGDNLLPHKKMAPFGSLPPIAPNVCWLKWQRSASSNVAGKSSTEQIAKALQAMGCYRTAVFFAARYKQNRKAGKPNTSQVKKAFATHRPAAHRSTLHRPGPGNPKI